MATAAVSLWLLGSTVATSPAAEGLDPAVSGTGGASARQVVRGHWEESRPSFDPDVILPPAWAFGVLHGYYTNQAGILANLKRLRAGDFPADAIWVDSAFWDLTTKGPTGYLDFRGDRNAFPDLRGLTAELEKRQVRFGIWIWDRIMDANREVYDEFESRGYFAPGRIAGDGWHNAGLRSVGRAVDFSNPAAAALWSEKLRPFLRDGVDFFKMDSLPQTDYLRTHFELSKKYGRHTRGRGFVLTQANRSSLVDIKRYPAAWTGDAQSSWHQPDYPDTSRWILGGLRQQIEMVANPTWRHYDYPFLANDTGGFHPRSLQGAEAEELYVRWAQFSAFGSIMQVFGSPQVPEQNAPFAWPNAVQENFRRHTHLRLRLFPYIYSHALLTRLTGQKIIRGDAEHRLQYRFGDAFLVAPVCEPGTSTRSVWLPPDEHWVDYWTGRTYPGGQEVNVPAPLDHLPLLVRAGSIIPLRDYAPSVLKGNNATLTLDVYPEGAKNASQFTLYEDDGTSNEYLTNGFAATPITLETDTARNTIRLRVASIEGDYHGRPKHRRWKLQMHLATTPVEVTLNRKKVSWNYDLKRGCLLLSWKSSTARAAEVNIRTAH